MEQVRDAMGTIIGSVQESGTGDRVYRDMSGRVVGQYQVATNQTINHMGMRIGVGDHGVSLLDMARNESKGW